MYKPMVTWMAFFSFVYIFTYSYRVSLDLFWIWNALHSLIRSDHFPIKSLQKAVLSDIDIFHITHIKSQATTIILKHIQTTHHQQHINTFPGGSFHISFSFSFLLCTLLKKTKRQKQKNKYIKYEDKLQMCIPGHYFRNISFFKTYSQHKFSSNLFTSRFPR